MRRLCVFVLSALSAAGLPALDFGVNLDNASSYFNTGVSSFSQGDTVSAWLRLDAAQVGRFDAALSYDFALTASEGKATLVEPYRFDVALLRWVQSVKLDKALFNYELGRRRVVDLTGLQYDSRMDGLRAELLTDRVELWGGAEYTGLVVKKNSNVQVGSTDLANAKNDAVVFAPPRLVAYLGTAFPELFLRQDLSAELSGQFDLGADRSAGVSNYQLALRLKGPVALGFSEQLFAVAQLVQTNGSLGFAWMAGGRLQWKLDLPGASLGLSGLVSSGQGGGASSFVTTAGRSLTTALVVKAGNVADLGLDFACSPLPKLSLGAKVVGLFRTSDQTLGLSGMKASSTGRFLGVEPSLFGYWDLAQEFYCSLSAGVFVPYAGGDGAATFNAGAPASWLVSAGFGFAF